MPDFDELYNQPIQEVFRQALRDPEGLKGQLLNALREAYVDFLEAVANGDGVEDTTQRLEQGLEELTSTSTDTIESQLGQAQSNVEDAHQAGYLAAAAAASATVPDWTATSNADPYERAPFDGNVSNFVRESIETEVSYYKQDLKYIRKYVDEDTYAKAAAQVLARGDEGVKQALLDRGIDLDDIDTDSLEERAAQVFRRTKTMGSPDIRGILEELEPEELASRSPDLWRRVKLHGTDSLSRVMDEVAKDLAVQSPAVDLLSWELSPSHGGEYAPDACDYLAQQDVHGYGGGLYHPSTIPQHPHPFCLCSVRAITKDPSDWGDRNRPLPDKPSIDPQDVREKLKSTDGGRTVTDAHVQKQTEEMQAAIDAVYESPR